MRSNCCQARRNDCHSTLLYVITAIEQGIEADLKTSGVSCTDRLNKRYEVYFSRDVPVSIFFRLRTDWEKPLFNDSVATERGLASGVAFVKSTWHIKI